MERREQMLEMRKAGLTYAEIGYRLGISKEGARYIVKGIRPYHKPALDSKVMLRTAEAGVLIGVHINTIRRWTEKGVLSAYRIGSRGDRRYRREDIERFLEQSKQ